MPRFDVVTIFPEFFGHAGDLDSGQAAAGFLGHGVLRRALFSRLIEVRVHDLRSYTSDRHRTVDDRPFGGGEGMVLKPEPLAAAVAAMGVQDKRERDTGRETVILLSAGGARFDQAAASELAAVERIVLLCGRYEGVDERVAQLIADRELSIGDYVLSGGELGAAVVIDAVARLVPGVLGNSASSEFESFGKADSLLHDDARDGASTPPATHGTGGLLDYPHYTRPPEFGGVRVPEVLVGGNHEQVRRWRRQQSLARTARNRPDLLEHAIRAGDLTEEEQRFVALLGREEAGNKD